MDSHKVFREVVSGCATAFGGPKARFDRDDYAHLVYDNKFVYSFQYLAERKSLVVFIILGRVPESVLAKILEYSLHANLFWQGNRGATLGFDGDRQSLVLQQRIHLVGLNPSYFQAKMKDMAEVATVWVALLKRAAKLPASPAPSPGTAPAGGATGAPPFTNPLDPNRFA